MIRQVKESNGMEAYRLLVQSLEPTSKNRALGLLTMMLEWKPFEMKKGSILGQVLRLEEALAEYEKTGSKLEDNIRFAVLMRCVGGQLKTWLQLNVTEPQDYQKLREAIIQYDNATMRWTNVMMLGAEASGTDGVVPMEIDRIKGKGNDHKGKGKGKTSTRKEKERAMAKERPKGKAMENLKILEASPNQRAQAKGMAKRARRARLSRRLALHVVRWGISPRTAGNAFGKSVRKVETPDPVPRPEQWHRAPRHRAQGRAGKQELTVKRVEKISPFEFKNEPMVFDLRPMSMPSMDSKQIRMVQFFSISEENEPSEEHDKLIYHIMAVKERYGCMG